MKTKNHYELLGVLPDASQHEIRNAYRAKIRLYHPDYFSGQRQMAESLGDQQKLFEMDIALKEAEEMTKRLNNAYATLSDPVKRWRYDQHLPRRETEASYYQPPTAATVREEPSPYTSSPTKEAKFWARVVNYYVPTWIILILILILVIREIAIAFGR